MRARRSLNTAPASIITVTPLGTFHVEPSDRAVFPGPPNPIS